MPTCRVLYLLDPALGLRFVVDFPYSTCILWGCLLFLFRIFLLACVPALLGARWGPVFGGQKWPVGILHLRIRTAATARFSRPWLCTECAFCGHGLPLVEPALPLPARALLCCLSCNTNRYHDADINKSGRDTAGAIAQFSATRGNLLHKMSSSKADQRRTQEGMRGVCATKKGHSDTYTISPNNKRWLLLLTRMFLCLAIFLGDASTEFLI